MGQPAAPDIDIMSGFYFQGLFFGVGGARFLI